MAAANPRKNLPVVIMIFNNNGKISYRSYSPASHHLTDDYYNYDSDSNISPEQCKHFYICVYNAITLHNEYVNNIARREMLVWVHNLLSTKPCVERGNTLYFTTCKDKYHIDENGPILFDSVLAQEYANDNPNVSHHSCSHEFV